METWYIWHDGEKAAGLGGDQAEVKFDPHLEWADPGDVERVVKEYKKRFAKIFAEIWNWPEKQIKVMTEEEIKDD